MRPIDADAIRYDRLMKTGNKYEYAASRASIDAIPTIELKQEAVMEKLKPCPFCGGEVEMKERFRRGTANRKMFWAECKACWVSQYHGDAGGYATKAKAVKAWNRRVVERGEDGET